MLSYVHAFHAGNHADILKHLVLSLSLERLRKKEAPFTVYDTHAGSGLYRLDDERLLRTGEAESGVRPLLAALKGDKATFSEEERCAAEEIERSAFFALVAQHHERNEYPGSPLVERLFLRHGDEQILSELHPRAVAELRLAMESRREPVKPRIHFRDGFETLLSLTPPRTRRGLVIMDPSFEEADDFVRAADTIRKLLKKWSGAVVLLWYPLVPHRKRELSRMKEAVAESVPGGEKLADFRLVVKDEGALRGLSSLYGSGVLAVNPPFGLAERMGALIPFLEKVLRR